MALFSPIMALFVKPVHYSFYMFLPARPENAIDRVRLITANGILILGSAAAVLGAIVLALRAVRTRRYIGLLCPVLVFLNPFQQPVFFESLDTHYNYQMRDKAEALHIIGKTPSEVRALLGRPIRKWSESPRVLDGDGKVTWQGEPYTGWEYQPLPFYWFGSRFQVFFVNGKVRNFEANDD